MVPTLFRYPALGLAGVFLASCGSASPEMSELSDQPLDCALAGAPDFAAGCFVQTPARSDDRRRVILHPDGGFRVFEFAETPSGLAPADGALEAGQEVVGDTVIVTVGRDRYRFGSRVSDD